MLSQIDLTPVLKRGIAPYNDDAASDSFLSAAYNGRCTDRGFVSRDWETLLTTATTIASPFPQAFAWAYSSLVLLFHATKIYTTNGVTETEIPVYADTDYVFPGVLKSGASALTLTASGKAWQVAFLHDGFVATDTVNLLFYVPSVGLFKHTGRANTVCEHFGRLYLGGFSTSYPIYSTTYKAKVLSFSTKDLITTVPDLTEEAIHASCVSYDDVLDLLAPWRMTAESYRAQLQRDEGLVAFLDCGAVYKLLPLGSNIVCYSMRGVFILSHHVDPNLLEVKKISTKGIKSVSAVGGNDRQHLYIDADNRFVLFTEEGRKFLDYKDLAATISEPISIFVDESNDDFIVTTTTTCCLFVEGRLSSVLQYRVTGSLCTVGSKVGYYQVPAGTFYQTIYTGVLRFGRADYKTIMGLELDSNSPTSVAGLIYYRNGPADAWSDTGWITFDKAGYLDYPVSCTECKIMLRTAFSSTSVNVDFNGLRLVLDDRRLGLKELL